VVRNDVVVFAVVVVVVVVACRWFEGFGLVDVIELTYLLTGMIKDDVVVAAYLPAAHLCCEPVPCCACSSSPTYLPLTSVKAP
jgi:hypothetical protein